METIAHALESNMLACPSKTWAGIACPGCGFQTSLVALLRGNLTESWNHYPPLLPFLLLMALLLFFLVRNQISRRAPEKIIPCVN